MGSLNAPYMRLILDTSVLAALDQLRGASRARVMQVFESLEASDKPLSELVDRRDDLKRLTFRGSLYELKIPTNFRALLQPEGEQVKVIALGAGECQAKLRRPRGLVLPRLALYS